MKITIQTVVSSLPLIFTRKSAIVSGWAAVVLVASLFAGDAMLYLSEDSEDMEHVSAVIRNYFLIVAGVAAFIFTAIRVRQTDKQISQANDQIQIAKSEADGRENERVRESFQQAVAMLYGDEDETKPFAITQLRRIALDKPGQYLEQAISLLCGFARKHSSDPGDDMAGIDMSRDEERTFELTRQSLDFVFELSKVFEEQGRGPAPIKLRNTFLSHRVITGVTLAQSSIEESAFYEVEFNDCIFTGIFQGETIKYDSVTGEQLWRWCFDGVRFVNTKFDHASFYNVSFMGVEIRECKAEFSTWQGCDLTQSAFSALKIIDEKSQNMEPKNYRVLFTACAMTEVAFSFPPSGTTLDSDSSNEGRYSYFGGDFFMCYIRGYKPMPTSRGERDPEPKGLENNLPQLEVEVTNSKGSCPIVVREKNRAVAIENVDTHD